jgi:hypothetical protein
MKRCGVVVPVDKLDFVECQMHLDGFCESGCSIALRSSDVDHLLKRVERLLLAVRKSLKGEPLEVVDNAYLDIFSMRTELEEPSPSVSPSPVCEGMDND